MLLENINGMKRLMLVRELSQDDAWKKVAIAYDLIVRLKEPSADCLINALENRNCTVENLEKCLRALGLHRACSFISEPERIRLIRQPYCVETEDVSKDGDALCIRAGGKLHLKIDAVGHPFPSYEWFRDNISLSKSPELKISNFSEDMEGLYYCTIQQLQDFGLERRVISEDVSVKINIKVVYEAPRILSYFPTEKCVLECGQCLKARIEVQPDPTTKFSWRHNCAVIREHTSSELEIPNITEAEAGTYECLVSNAKGECPVEFQFDVLKRRPFPTAKRALIVTNSLYKSENLKTPPHDAKVLSDCLETKYGFTCTLKSNLSGAGLKRAIDDFFKSLDKKGAFVLFYFGGHGCRPQNSLFMMGTDADLTNVKENQGVYSTVLEDVCDREPLLFISILDMCQVSNNNLRGEFSNKKWTCNVIKCCATSQNREALEHIGTANENSVYIKHFAKIFNTKENMSFLNMIEKVNRGVEEETKKRQQPTAEFMGRGDFHLSDPIQIT